MTDAEIVMLALRCLRDNPMAQQWAPYANAAIARRIPQRVCDPAIGGWQFSYDSGAVSQRRLARSERRRLRLKP